jgi:hypothetical protein
VTVLDLIDGRIAELDRLMAEAAGDQAAAVGERAGLSLLLATLCALKAAKASRQAYSEFGEAIAGGGAACHRPGAGQIEERFIFVEPGAAARRRASPGWPRRSAY